MDQLTRMGRRSEYIQLRAVKSSLVSDFVDGGTASKTCKKKFHFQVAVQCCRKGTALCFGMKVVTGFVLCNEKWVFI